MIGGIHWFVEKRLCLDAVKTDVLDFQAKSKANGSVELI